MPASAARNASASADNGVSSAGLATTVQPAAKAGAIFRASMQWEIPWSNSGGDTHRFFGHDGPRP